MSDNLNNSWRERFDDADFGLQFLGSESEQMLKAFIAKEIERAQEEGRQEADWMGETLLAANKAGRAATLKTVRELVEGMKKKNTGLDEEASGYNWALSDLLTKLEANEKEV